MANGRKVDLKITKVSWVPTVAAFPAITAVEATAGTDLTPFIKDLDFDAEDYDTVEERGIQDTVKSVIPTIGNSSATITFFNQFDTSTGKMAITTGTPMYLFFANGALPTGYLVMRQGPVSTVAYATGDVVKAGCYIAETPKTPGGKNDGYGKMTVKFDPQNGQYNPAIVLT